MPRPNVESLDDVHNGSPSEFLIFSLNNLVAIPQLKLTDPLNVFFFSI